MERVAVDPASDAGPTPNAATLNCQSETRRRDGGGYKQRKLIASFAASANLYSVSPADNRSGETRLGSCGVGSWQLTRIRRTPARSSCRSARGGAHWLSRRGKR